MFWQGRLEVGRPFSAALFEAEAVKVFNEPAPHDSEALVLVHIGFRIFVTLVVRSALRWLQMHKEAFRSAGIEPRA